MEDPAGPAALKQSASSDSPRLFESDVLDWLSRVYHFVPLFLYLPLVVVLVGFALFHFSVAGILAGLAAGYAIWTLVEYFGHRYLFHMRLPGAIGERIHFLIHGVHHVHPSDPLRLVMPPLLSAPIMLAGFVVLRLICGPEFVMPVFAGFVGGYLTYDMVHFHVHHATPRTWLGRLLRRRHMFHHFRDDTVLFGVSAPWWDVVFGTDAGAPGKRAAGSD